MKVVMMPVAAWLFGAVGVAWILIFQGACSIFAALIENSIRITEQTDRTQRKNFSLRQWIEDIQEAAVFLRDHKGLYRIFSYMAVTNGVATGYSPIIIAFFRTAPGFSVAMYSFFSIAEFAGRSLGGLLHYNVSIPPKRRFAMAFLIYQIYELMDMILLWIPYPFMLANRAACGFLALVDARMVRLLAEARAGGRQVIMAGDLNVVRSERDIKNWRSNHNRVSGVLDVEIEHLEG